MSSKTCIASLCSMLVLASAALAQLGSVGPVRDTGGPLRESSQAVRDATGAVRESSLPNDGDFRRPLSGLPVSAGSRSVYGSGSVRDATAGSVADIGRSGSLPVFLFEYPQNPNSGEGLESLETSLRTLTPSEEDQTTPEETASKDTEVASDMVTESTAESESPPGEGEVAPIREPSQHDISMHDEEAEHSLTEDSSSDQSASSVSRSDEGELLLGREPTQ